MLSSNLLSMEDAIQKENKKCCCIAHHFYTTASSNPDKIAVIHAFGGALLSRRRRRISAVDSTSDPPPPPPFNGDECFTFSQLLSAVDSLSSRLFRVLNGSLDDPGLRSRKSSDNSCRNTSMHVETGDSLHRGQKRSKMVHESDKQKRVAVYMVPSVYYITAVLSILRCGEAFMPIDPSWPKERVLSVLLSSNVDLIICCQNSKKTSYCTGQLEEPDWLIDSCDWPILCLSIGETFMDKSCQLKSPWPCESAKSRTFSYVMCTSGSTGKPKGVCGTEEGLLNRFWWLQELYPLKGDDFLLFKTPISFIDHIQEFLAAILTAATLVIPPVNELKENMFSLIDFLQDYSISRLTAVPSLVKALVGPLRSPYYIHISSSLKLLLISGETFGISLWHALSSLFPRTSILNIYGCTEVSGDCTYFDCKWLPMLIESQILSTVPIGNPITNCNVTLFKEDGTLNEGEICVNGCCLANGYISENKTVPFDYVELPDDSHSLGVCRKSVYFRTGDFAKQLPSGDLVFLGRKDRTVKVNGQRIALEEVEGTLRGHPEVVDAAVVFNKDEREYEFLRAFVVLKQDRLSDSITPIKSWMIEKLPTAMIPKEILCIEALPMSFSGKVDYALLSGISSTYKSANQVHMVELVEKIKKAFSNALAVEFSHDSNFFEMGGDSVTAAHIAHDLGIDMRLIYIFPTPSELQSAMLEKRDLLNAERQLNWEALRKAEKSNLLDSESESSDAVQLEGERSTLTMNNNSRTQYIETSKLSKVDENLFLARKGQNLKGMHPWKLSSKPVLYSISRCHRVLYGGNDEGDDVCREGWELQLPRQSTGLLQELWKVHMESCIDASPVVLFGDNEVLLFIGSHSHIFLCINARSGSVQWEIKLEGRIECSAVIDGDFHQVIVGCYKGKIYFIDIKSGEICWSFQTNGEVKSEPFIDKHRHLVWCGSYDHMLYALDYRNHCCVYQFPCGGSVFSSPIVDEVKRILYVATTSGCLTAISLKNLSFSKLWLLKLDAPIFGSLAICSLGNVICCLVNGCVTSVNGEGSIVWKIKTDGPLFAGACVSRSCLSQGIVCSRGGSVYCLQLAKGTIIWQYNVGSPITASAYIDEHSKLNHAPSKPGDRLICICSSSGKVLVLRSNTLATERDEDGSELVEKFAELELCGEIFSSPVMIGGRIFVGGRDDYLHCYVVGASDSNVRSALHVAGSGTKEMLAESQPLGVSRCNFLVHSAPAS